MAGRRRTYRLRPRLLLSANSARPHRRHFFFFSSTNFRSILLVALSINSMQWNFHQHINHRRRDFFSILSHFLSHSVDIRRARIDDFDPFFSFPHCPHKFYKFAVEKKCWMHGKSKAVRAPYMLWRLQPVECCAVTMAHLSVCLPQQTAFECWLQEEGNILPFCVYVLSIKWRTADTCLACHCEQYGIIFVPPPVHCELLGHKHEQLSMLSVCYVIGFSAFNFKLA